MAAFPPVYTTQRYRLTIMYYSNLTRMLAYMYMTYIQQIASLSSFDPVGNLSVVCGGLFVASTQL